MNGPIPTRENLCDWHWWAGDGKFFRLGYQLGMRPFVVFSIFAVGGMLMFGCKPKAQQMHPVAHVTNLSVWMTNLVTAKSEQDLARASNAVHQIGSNAVPALLQMVRNHEPGFYDSTRTLPRFFCAPMDSTELSLQIALTCRALGDMAEPVVVELSSRLMRRETSSAATKILLNIGPDCLRNPAVTASLSAVHIAVMTFPERYLPVLIEVYERAGTNAYSSSRSLLDYICTAVPTDRVDVESLLPLLRKTMQHRDPFIRSQVIMYFGICGTNASSAISDVTKLLSDKDPGVQTAATNALRGMTGLE